MWLLFQTFVICVTIYYWSNAVPHPDAAGNTIAIEAVQVVCRQSHGDVVFGWTATAEMRK